MSYFLAPIRNKSPYSSLARCKSSLIVQQLSYFVICSRNKFIYVVTPRKVFFNPDTQIFIPSNFFQYGSIQDNISWIIQWNYSGVNTQGFCFSTFPFSFGLTFWYNKWNLALPNLSLLACFYGALPRRLVQWQHLATRRLASYLLAMYFFCL